MIEGGVTGVTALLGWSYVDIRDTVNRLGRVRVFAAAAYGWLPLLDPKNVRMISDADLAALVGGTLTPPEGWPPGTYGAGGYGLGPYGGEPSDSLYPGDSLYPSDSLYPHS